MVHCIHSQILHLFFPSFILVKLTLHCASLWCYAVAHLLCISSEKSCQTEFAQHFHKVQRMWVTHLKERPKQQLRLRSLTFTPHSHLSITHYTSADRTLISSHFHNHFMVQVFLSSTNAKHLPWCNYSNVRICVIALSNVTVSWHHLGL